MKKIVLFAVSLVLCVSAMAQNQRAFFTLEKAQPVVVQHMAPAQKAELGPISALWASIPPTSVWPKARVLVLDKMRQLLLEPKFPPKLFLAMWEAELWAFATLWLLPRK